MGRPRKPTATKNLKGRSKGRDSGGRPLPREPEYSRSLPDPPQAMNRAGKEEWKRLGPELIKANVLTTADWAVFASYCDAFGRYWEIRAKMAPPGYYSDPQVSREWHRLDRALDRAEKQLVKARSELGLSPTERSKVSLPTKKEEAADPTGKFKRPKLRAIKGGKR